MNGVRETGEKSLGNDNKAPSDGAIKQGSGQVRARKKEILRNTGVSTVQQRGIEKGDRPNKGNNKIKLRKGTDFESFKKLLKKDGFGGQKLKIKVGEDFYESLGEKEKTAFDKLMQERYQRGDAILMEYGHRLKITFISKEELGKMLEKKSDTEMPKPEPIKIKKELTVPSWASEVIMWDMLERTVTVPESVSKLEIRSIIDGALDMRKAVNLKALTLGGITEETKAITIPPSVRKLVVEDIWSNLDLRQAKGLEDVYLETIWGEAIVTIPACVKMLSVDNIFGTLDLSEATGLTEENKKKLEKKAQEGNKTLKEVQNQDVMVKKAHRKEPNESLLYRALQVPGIKSVIFLFSVIVLLVAYKLRSDRNALGI